MGLVYFFIIRQIATAHQLVAYCELNILILIFFDPIVSVILLQLATMDFQVEALGSLDQH